MMKKKVEITQIVCRDVVCGSDWCENGNSKIIDCRCHEFVFVLANSGIAQRMGFG